MSYFLLIGLALFGVLFWGHRSEKRDWNSGISPFTGTPWRQFDTDSHGGRGYVDDGGNQIWISYPVDKT